MRKTLLINLAVLAGTALVLFLGAEASVRLVIDDGMQYDLEMWKYARSLKRVAANPDQGHEHVPGRSAHLMGADVSINAHGQRDREFDKARTPGIKRIMMLGDSLTFGWGVPQGETVAKHLEAQLEAEGGERYEVINTGVGNTNTAMQVAYFLTQGVEFQPDIVVLNFFINDAEPTPRRKSGFFTEWSAAVVYFQGKVDALTRRWADEQTTWDGYYRDLFVDERAGWIAAKAALQTLSDVCREKGIKLLVANYPELHAPGDYPFPEVTAKLAAASDAAGVPFVDLLPAVASEPAESLWVCVGDQHPNGHACELFAGAIRAALREHFGV